MDVLKVIAGVVVAVATVPAKPLADTTEALVTVPAPAGAAQTTQNLSLSNVVSFSADTTLFFNIGAAVSAGTWGAANVGVQNRITFIQIGF